MKKIIPIKQTIPSWSYSRLQDFEKCKQLAKFKYLDKIPEPERELPPGKTEFANDRGTRIHENCEQYVNGTTDVLMPEADKHFGLRLDLLRTMFKDGLVSLEGEWATDKDWNPVEWKKGWLRLKLDAMVMHDKHTATVIDFKSGKRFGNEVKHAEQLQLYQLVTFLRYPHLETVYAELWYLDQDEVTSQKYTRNQGLRFKANFERRGSALTSCTEFPANGNMHSCRWCMYGVSNGGPCQSEVKFHAKARAFSNR